MFPQQEIRSLQDCYAQDSSSQALNRVERFEDYLQTLGGHPEILRDSLLGTEQEKNGTS